jgi:hypothetical protein
LIAHDDLVRESNRFCKKADVHRDFLAFRDSPIWAVRDFFDGEIRTLQPCWWQLTASSACRRAVGKSLVQT